VGSEVETKIPVNERWAVKRRYKSNTKRSAGGRGVTLRASRPELPLKALYLKDVTRTSETIRVVVKIARLNFEFW